MALLSLERVCKRFDGVTAVDSVSFAVDPGQVVGFLGPNGAGKSTTMRMITQFYEPDSGEIRLDGVPLADAAREAKRRIGYLAENNPQYDDMLVADYLAFIADLRELAGLTRRQALDAAITGTGIESVYYRPIGELSKGFRQRVGLAQAMLHRPDLLVLDEPTEGLDPNQRVEIRRLIATLGRDRTVILSTHVLSEVQHTCSRLLVISRGKIVADGPVDRLIQQAEGAVAIAVEAAGTGIAEALRELPGVRRVDARPRRGPSQRHARGRAGATDHGARAAARQVRWSGAVPPHRARPHPDPPDGPRPGSPSRARDPAGTVRRGRAADRRARRRGYLGLERHAQPDHRLHSRRRGDVRADPGRARSLDRRASPPTRGHRRIARRAVAFHRHRPRRDRPARRGVLPDARRDLPAARLLRADASQAHGARSVAAAAAPRHGAARRGDDRREPAGAPHRGSARPDAGTVVHARARHQADPRRAPRHRDHQAVCVGPAAARGC